MERQRTGGEVRKIGPRDVTDDYYTQAVPSHDRLMRLGDYREQRAAWAAERAIRARFVGDARMAEINDAMVMDLLTDARDAYATANDVLAVHKPKP